MASLSAKVQKLLAFEKQTQEIVEAVAGRYGVLEPPILPPVRGHEMIDVKVALAALNRAMVEFTIQLVDAAVAKKTSGKSSSKPPTTTTTT
jgi:hypothetical protein